jgi:uncharacterized damage-inducible protein DinB
MSSPSPHAARNTSDRHRRGSGLSFRSTLTLPKDITKSEKSMSASLSEISFSELLDWNERETQKWRDWFARQDASMLDLPMRIAQTKNVREFLLHIFAVELRYAQRLNDEEVTSYEALPTETVADLFGIGDRARAGLRGYLANVTDDELKSVQEFPTRTAGTLRASERKMFAHAMLHSVRHWAQLATALREAGHATDWGKDFLMSDVME